MNIQYITQAYSTSQTSWYGLVSKRWLNEQPLFLMQRSIYQQDPVGRCQRCRYPRKMIVYHILHSWTLICNQFSMRNALVREHRPRTRNASVIYVRPWAFMGELRVLRRLTGGRIWDWEMMLLGRLFWRLSVETSAHVTWKPVIGWCGWGRDTLQRKLAVTLPSWKVKAAVRFSGLAKTFDGAGGFKKNIKYIMMTAEGSELLTTHTKLKSTCENSKLCQDAVVFINMSGNKIMNKGRTNHWMKVIESFVLGTCARVIIVH